MTKIKYYIFAIILYFISPVLANTINPDSLRNEILEYNSEKRYDASIKRLTEIIYNPKSTNYDIYNAYLQKYLTFKSLYNYPEAEENLDKAEKYGLLSDKAKEVQTRIDIERIFIEFDLGNHLLAEGLVSKINEKDLDLVDSETHAFFYSVLGTFELKKNNFEAAETYYDKAIEILKRDSPKHIANLYRAKMSLYIKLRDEEKVLKAFELGVKSAKENKMDVYVLNLYEHLTHYYAEVGNFKKAYENRTIVNRLATEYDALNASGKILLLEKDIINEQNNEVLNYEKNKQIFLIALAVILIILIVVLYLLFRANRDKRKLIEAENVRMRDELSSLLKESTQQGNVEFDLNSYNLSERQINIIKLVEKGKTNKEIGAELFISENTVKYHLKIIYNTLGIDNRNSLIKD